MLCFELVCPVHGIPDPRLRELDAEDTKSFCINEGVVHRSCHDATCRSPRCAAEAA